MKWIKASERLPIFSHKTISRFIHTQTPLFDAQNFAIINPDKVNEWEWLDESTPPVSANDAALMDVDKPDGVYAVNLSWGINYHPTDLSKVMKAKDCLFIGTGKECADFIYKNKPAPVSAREDGWVDVRNALPDNEGLYLAWVTNHSFLGPPESFFIVYYGFANDEDATEMFWSYMMKPIDVTHWRPLPPPPSK